MALKSFVEWCKDQLTISNTTNNKINTVNQVPTNSAGLTHTVTTNTNCPSCGSTGACLCGGTTITATTPYIHPLGTITLPQGLQFLGGAPSWGQIQQILGYGAPLSQSEQNELAQLKEQHELETKALRKQEFKSLHKDIRQMIVSHVIWYETQEKMRRLNAQKTQRLLDLEAKEFTHKHGTTHLGSITSVSHINFQPFDLDCGLSKIDLIEAHTEACLEEKLCGFDT